MTGYTNTNTASNTNMANDQVPTGTSGVHPAQTDPVAAQVRIGFYQLVSLLHDALSLCSNPADYHHQLLLTGRLLG